MKKGGEEGEGVFKGKKSGKREKKVREKREWRKGKVWLNVSEKSDRGEEGGVCLSEKREKRKRGKTFVS